MKKLDEANTEVYGNPVPNKVNIHMKNGPFIIVSGHYYTEFAKMVPEDCMILTLACGKYRFNKLEFGEVAGLPRLSE